MAELALPLLARSPWARRLLLPMAFSLALVFFLIATFPYDALALRIVSEAKNAGYDVSIGALSHGGLIGVTATDVHVKPTTPDGATGALELHFDKLTLKPSILGLLLRRTVIGFDVDAYGGSSHGTARVSNDPKAPGLSELTLTAADFDLKQLPSSILSGVEVIGTFSSKVDVQSLQALEASGGTITFGLKGGALVKGSVMGIPLPKTMLGELTGGLVVDRGVARLDKVLLRGGDIDAEVEGSIRLKPLFSLSQAELKVHLKPKDSWLDANPLVKGSMGFLGPKGPDGYWVTLSGPLTHLNPRPGK